MKGRERLPVWAIALATVFLVAWVWRLLYVGRLSRTVLAGDLTADSAIYWEWSKLLIEQGFLGRNPFFFGPLYPYALALLRLALGDSIHVVLQVQLVWGALAAVLIADAARRLTRPAVGFAMGVIAALYPMAVFFDGLILMESLLFFLESALLWWIVRAGRVPLRTGELVAAGALIGLIAQGRATAAGLLLPAALFLLPWHRARSTRGTSAVVPSSPDRAVSPRPREGLPASSVGRRPRLAPSAVALAAGFALVALPVAMRTWAVSHEWIPFTYNLGVNLYIGNSAEAMGGFSSIMETQLSSPVGPIREDGGVEADGREYLRKVEGVTLGPRASSDYWAAKAWRWMRDHPGEVLRLWLRKLGMMWSRREYPQIENADEFELLAGPLGLPGIGGFALLGALAFPGLVLAWSRGPAARFTLGYVVVVTLAVLPFFVVDRYRHHLVPGVALLAALTLEQAWSLARRREGGQLVLLGAGVLAGIAIAFAPGPAMSKRKYEWGLAFDIGLRWQARGQPALAARAFEHAIRLELRGTTLGSGSMHAAEHADLYYNYGLALRALARDAEALVWFERAAKVAPDRAPAIRALADAWLRRGEAARADSLYAALEGKVGGEGLSFEGRGWLAAQRGRLDEAAALFDQAVRVEPDLTDAWGALIRARVQLGRLAAAESALARAEGAGLPQPSLEAHRALVEILAGDREGAEHALSRVPQEALSADSVLADVVQVARRALKNVP